MAFTCWEPRARTWTMLQSTAAMKTAYKSCSPALTGPIWLQLAQTPSPCTPSRTQIHLSSIKLHTSCLSATSPSSRQGGLVVRVSPLLHRVDTHLHPHCFDAEAASCPAFKSLDALCKSKGVAIITITITTCASDHAVARCPCSMSEFLIQPVRAC